MSVTVGAVLEKTQEMEYLLKTNFGATGKGLNEYLDSIQGTLPADLVKKIRFVATIRNKLVHERGYQYDGDEDDFWALCDTVITRLTGYDESPAAAPRYVEPEPPAARVRYEGPVEGTPPAEYQPNTRPWYRSKWFLLVLFLLLPPVWALWMLLDRDRGFLAKGVGTLVLLASAIAGLTVYSLLTSTETLGSSYTPAAVVRDATPIAGPAMTVLQETSQSTRPAPSGPALTPATAARPATCTVEWQEHNGDGLGGRNRNQVWNAVVKNQVAGSGLTAAKFYALVVEQNPVLKTDGYVFKKGKTYRLPKCK
jgi:hypothetical protein